jgi:ferredoxin
MVSKVSIDKEECIGCGTYKEICPKVFNFNEKAGKAEVIDSEGVTEDPIEEAIEACPVKCIHWEV